MDIEAWRQWRAESEGLTWRVAVPEDMPAITRMWEIKARLIGSKCELPDLFRTPVVLTLVAEDHWGRVVDGVFFEAVIDCTKLSAKPSAFRSLTAIAAELGAFFRGRKFRRVMAAMPKNASERMADGLTKAGFEQQQLCLWERNL